MSDYKIGTKKFDVFALIDAHDQIYTNALGDVQTFPTEARATAVANKVMVQTGHAYIVSPTTLRARTLVKRVGSGGDNRT